MKKDHVIRKIVLSGNRIDKRLNEYLVFKLIKEKGPISIPELLSETKLSRPTIDTFIARLRKKNLIIQSGFGTPHSGRRPKLWKLNGKAGYLIGVDMESPHLTVILTDLDLNIVQSSKSVFSLNSNSEAILATVMDRIHGIIGKSGVDQSKILGIGIGVPGLINKFRGVSVLIERIPDWKNVPVIEILNREFGVPVFLENDVRLMAIAEYSMNRELDEKKNMIYIGYRTGIGATIFIDEKPISGTFGNTGFIGHTTIEKDGPLCSCGNRGCLELYADEYVIIRQVKDILRDKAVKDLPSTGKKNVNEVTMETVIQLSKNGNSAITNILKKSAEYLGLGIANAVTMFDIPFVLMGGSIVQAGEQYLDWVKESALGRLSSIFKEHFELRYARIISDAAPLGGAILVLRDVFRQPSIPVR
jgi:predicted NBD/HSP70 family sugar kinase